MRDQFHGYDEWKLRSPDDEIDEVERRRQRAQDLEDRADDLRDREKDRQLNADAETAFDDAEWEALGETDLIAADELETFNPLPEIVQ